MREIKFRGFSIAKKKWVYGNYNYTFERGYISQGYDDVPPRCYYIDTETNYYEVYSQTVGQYTGLKNKDGKEIYDGDICESLDGLFLVVWNEEKAAFEIMFKEDGERLYLEEMWDDTKVIGNLHDNLDLWEVV